MLGRLGRLPGSNVPAIASTARARTARDMRSFGRWTASDASKTSQKESQKGSELLLGLHGSFSSKMVRLCVQTWLKAI